MDDDLGVAWLVKRLVVSKILKSKTPPDVSDVDSVLIEANTAGRMVWSSMVPAIVKRIVGSGDLESEMATEYAHRLGVDLDDVSARALKQGYNASLGKGIDRSLSWARVAEAWGLDGAQMRAFIGTMPKADYSGDIIPPRSKGQMEMMLNTRADRIRDNETYAMEQLAEQVHWMKLRETGEVGPDITKRWHTAIDERTCKICAPIDRKIVRVDKAFARGVFSPPVHPNCRCWVEILDESTVVTKNAPARQYARDEDGQFSSVNTLVPHLEGRSIPAAYRKVGPEPRPQLNKDQMAGLYRISRGRVWDDPQRFGLSPESGFDDFNEEVLKRVPYLVKEYPDVYLTLEPNEEIARKTSEVAQIIYESKIRAGKDVKRRLNPSYIIMPGSKEKIRTKPAELDGWWEIVGAGTLLQHEGLNGNYKIVPATKQDREDKHITLVYRPAGHMSSDGSARLAGAYRTVENYEVRGRLADQMNLKEGTDVSVVVPEGLYVPPSNIPQKEEPPTTRREKAFQSTAATHEVMGQHINFNLKPEKGEDPTPVKGTIWGPDERKIKYTDELPEDLNIAGMSLDEITQMLLDENEGVVVPGSKYGTSSSGDDWGSGLVGSGDQSVGRGYNSRDKSRLSKRLPLGDRKGTLLPWAFMKI
jgi:hypothetical protein